MGYKHLNNLLQEFNGSNYIYKLSFDRAEAENYVAADLNTLFVSNMTATLLPENKSFNISDEELSYLIGLGESACIEINSGKKIASAFGMLNDNTLYITDKCNSNCIMCPMAEPVRRDGHTVPFEIQDELIRYMPYGMEHITITGGEPFIIREKLFDILQKLKEGNKARAYLLLSNGRFFASHEYCHKFAEVVPEDFLVGIPLHGPTADIHDAISQAPGSFVQTTAGIKNLLATKMMSVEIRIVVSKLNASCLVQLAEYIVKNYPSIDSVKFMGMEMLGNANVNSDKVWIPYEEAFKYICPAIDILVDNAIDVAIYNFPLCFVDRPYWNLCANSITAHKIKYADACSNCKEKNACGGMFTGTDRFLANSVKPIL